MRLRSAARKHKRKEAKLFTHTHPPGPYQIDGSRFAPL